MFYASNHSQRRCREKIPDEVGYLINTGEKKTCPVPTPFSSPSRVYTHLKVVEWGWRSAWRSALLFSIVQIQHTNNKDTLLALFHVLWFQASRRNCRTDKVSYCGAYLLKTGICLFYWCWLCSVGFFVLAAGQDVSEGPRPPWNCHHVLVAVDCFSSSPGSAQCFKA